MSDTPFTDLVEKLYKRLSRIGLITDHVAGYEQIVGSINDSLDEISRRRWITGKPGQASVAAGSQIVTLPPDWLIKNRVNKEILRAIYTGRDPNAPRPTNPSLQNQVNYNTGYGFGAVGYGSRYAPTSRNLSQPLSAPNPPVEIPEARTELIDDEQVMVFTLSAPSGVAQAWNLIYNARYVIKDATEGTDAINTFPEQYEHILFRVAKVIIAADRAFDLDLSNGKRDPLDSFERREKIINGICAEITSRGRNR